MLIPCYNEELNVEPISQAVIECLETELSQYDYELVFIDNDSSDGTRPILRRLCAGNPKIKAIFNAKNFGQFNCPLLRDAAGDGRLRHHHGLRFPGSGGAHPPVCEGVGERIQDRYRDQDQQPGESRDVLAQKLLL